MSESVQHPAKVGWRNKPPKRLSCRARLPLPVLALLGSSLLAAVSTLVVTMIAQRALNGSELTEFLLFWGAFHGDGYYHGYSAGDYACGGYGTHSYCN